MIRISIHPSAWTDQRFFTFSQISGSGLASSSVGFTTALAVWVVMLRIATAQARTTRRIEGRLVGFIESKLRLSIGGGNNNLFERSEINDERHDN